MDNRKAKKEAEIIRFANILHYPLCLYCKSIFLDIKYEYFTTVS